MSISFLRFKPGQLVEIDPMMLSVGERITLYNVPGGFARNVDERVSAIGWLVHGDVALMITRERHRAGEVYVLGPNGGGWTSAAFLKILQDTQGDFNPSTQ